MTKSFPIVTSSKTSIPLTLVTRKDYAPWLKKQSAAAKQWLESHHFAPEPGSYCLLPGGNGAIGEVVCIADKTLGVWSIAHLPQKLPVHTYELKGSFSKTEATELALGWALSCYQFTRYKKSGKKFATLVAPKGCDMKYVESMTQATYWARDLINTPANDMNPEALATEAVRFAQHHKGKVNVIKGEALLKANWPMVYTVGKAASVPPHLVDMTFPRKGAPKVTLVGKGVCFDSGGLDIKPSSNMKMMKKDMGGAACVLALAKTILDMELPVSLRVILPIVENAVSGNAMRPLDVVPTRKGITVEIGNTDAEGRLILCDALFEADEDEPDLLIDCATLTGAARVALGTEIPAFFTPDDKLATQLDKAARDTSDPLWRLPLWAPYRKKLDTPNADLSNDPDSSYGGAITAALYLQEFVSKTPAWLHIDMMAWNLEGKPGRPKGGEAMAVRALYALIKERYGS